MLALLGSCTQFQSNTNLISTKVLELEGNENFHLTDFSGINFEKILRTKNTYLFNIDCIDCYTENIMLYRFKEKRNEYFYHINGEVFTIKPNELQIASGSLQKELLIFFDSRDYQTVVNYVSMLERFGVSQISIEPNTVIFYFPELKGSLIYLLNSNDEIVEQFKDKKLEMIDEYIYFYSD